jgi:hypothetical protein
MKVKLVVLLLLALAICYGQSGSASTSVYIQMYTNTTAIGASATVPNIGQVAHQMFLVFTNAPAHTCTAAGNAVGGSLQFSYNNSTWFNFGNPQVVPPFVLNQTYLGTGGFPFVRFNLTQFDTTNCIVNGFYTGSSSVASLSPSTINIGGSLYNQTTKVSFPFTPIAALTGGSVSYPIYACNMFTGSLIGPIAIGTNFIVDNSSVPFNVGICGITFTSSGVATVQVIEGTGTNCGTSGVNVSGVINLVAGVPITLGGNLGLVLKTSATTSTQVCLVVTGTAVNFNMSYAVLL